MFGQLLLAALDKFGREMPFDQAHQFAKLFWRQLQRGSHSLRTSRGMFIERLNARDPEFPLQHFPLRRRK
jgi:hypothetical protein